MVGRSKICPPPRTRASNDRGMNTSRPRRNVSPKNYEISSGLSWREERELNRALYASLQEKKKMLEGGASSAPISPQNSIPEPLQRSHSSPSPSTAPAMVPARRQSPRGMGRASGYSSSPSTETLPERPVVTPTRRKITAVKSHVIGSSTTAKLEPRDREMQAPPPTSVPSNGSSVLSDETSQDSSRSSVSNSTVESKGPKVKAQRKFAQMTAAGHQVLQTPGPNVTPVKKEAHKPSPIKVFPKMPKTEDFLTFLCLRGTDLLPPHLEFFNYSRGEEEPNGVAMPPSSKAPPPRDSSPSSSSTGLSVAQDDASSVDQVHLPTRLSRPLGRLTPNRKAARASAGTPETARGHVSMTTRNSAKKGNSSVERGRKSHQSAEVTPVKSHKSLSPSPKKNVTSMLKSGNEGRLATKRRAIATLHASSSRMRSGNLRERPDDHQEEITTDNKSSEPKVSPAKPVIEPRVLRQRHAGLPLRLRDLEPFPRVRPAKPTFIADRLPKRQARLRADRPYLEPDEMDHELLTFTDAVPGDESLSDTMENPKDKVFHRKETHSSREENIRATRSRKRKNSMSHDPYNQEDVKASFEKTVKLPVKKSRLEKIDKKVLKGKDFKRALFRKFKVKKSVVQEGTSPVATGNDLDLGVQTRTRSGSCRSEGSRSIADDRKTTENSSTIADGYSVALVSKGERKTTHGLQIVRKREKIKIKSLQERSAEGQLRRHMKLTKMVERKKRLKLRDQKQQAVQGKQLWPSQVGEDNSGDDVGKHFGPLKSTLRKQEVHADRAGSKVSARKEEMKEEVEAEEEEEDSEMTTNDEECPLTVEAPVFYPSEEEFQDPISYIQGITPRVENFGMCCITPPPSWKMECKLNEDARLETKKQMIHMLFHRFGPNVLQNKMISRYLSSQGVNESFPAIGGIEVDVWKLFRLIEDLGGPQKVTDKKKWPKVADMLGIPKTTQDRGSQLCEAFSKHVTPYLRLSESSIAKLRETITKQRAAVTSLAGEAPCLVKGRTMALGAFQKTGKHLCNQWYSHGNTAVDVIERDYWKFLSERKQHVVSHQAVVSDPSSLVASTKKDCLYHKHPWSLHNLALNDLSALSVLGPITGVTVPELSLNMLYSSSCWSRDTHGLPTLYFLHREADVLWYCVSPSTEDRFKSALDKVTPTLVMPGELWLRPNTVMVPPSVLAQHGVTVSRCVQKPGQFVLILPQCISSHVSCGFTVMESVHYATADWLYQGLQASKLLNRCHEVELFSIEELICRIILSNNINKKLLACAIPIFQCIVQEECKLRTQLSGVGLKVSKRMCPQGSQSSSLLGCHGDHGTGMPRCEVTKKICYISMVVNEAEGRRFCLEQGLVHLQKKKNTKTFRLLFRYTQDELKLMLEEAKARLTQPSPSLDPTLTSGKRKNNRKS